MPSSSSHFTKGKDNVDITIEIGDYKLEMSIPKQTKVSSLLTIVKNYEKIHQMYAPINSFFIGLASKNRNSVIDYWLTQSELDFVPYRKKLELKALYSIQKCIEKLSISEFEFLKCLGKGACGSVYLVRSKVTGYLFALKRLRKDNINDYKSWQAIIRQKKILSLLPTNGHTVTFHGSFESESHFNFIMDYYPGGELFLHLTADSVKLNEKEARVYFCEILLAMEFLHKQKILYRDLKPENILVDIQGHIRLTDFGMSKWGFEEEDVAQSQCGSQEYMAPEIFESLSYNLSADFYSLGAILYELLTGYPPYYGIGGDAQDSLEKLEQMKSMNLDMSMLEDRPYLKQLIQNLLNPDPQQRLCNYQQIKNNPWLAAVDWRQIEAKRSPLKFAPNIYNNYIGEQFLALQQEVEEINAQENREFQPLFEMVFNCVKQESKPLLLGVRPSNLSKRSLNSLNQLKHYEKENISQKRKTVGYLKEKPHKSTKHKQNYSIQLFEKEDSTNSSHSTSTQNNSNCSSNLPYDPKSTRHHNQYDTQRNKQNVCLFKKNSTKKLMTINDTIHRVVTRQPSEKHLLNRKPSSGNLLSSSKRHPSQQKVVTQSKQTPSTPIRLHTQQQNCHALIADCGPGFNKGDTQKDQCREHHLMTSKHKGSSKSILHPHMQSGKGIENYSSVMKNSKSQLKGKASHNASKSKSKDKLILKPRGKEGSTGGMTGQKAKLPTCTYKIKLM